MSMGVGLAFAVKMAEAGMKEAVKQDGGIGKRKSVNSAELNLIFTPILECRASNADKVAACDNLIAKWEMNGVKITQGAKDAFDIHKPTVNPYSNWGV